MKRAKTTFSQNSALWLSMILSVIIPMLLGIILSIYLSDWRWIQYPFHSMLESVGSISALTIATLMILMVNNNNLARHYIWVACALIGMGILDGFHAVLHAGISFVWLHSIATFAGGLTFAAVWSSDDFMSDKLQKILIRTVVTTTILIGIVSITFSDYLPAMVVQGDFSLLAKALNLIGGIGFLVGSGYFIYHKIKNKDPSNKEQKNEDIVFANHSLLFGIAGLLFELSIIWDAGWWWWHVLRLIAYLVVLVYFFTLFKQQQDILNKNKIELSNTNKNLEQRVYERTKELEVANEAKSEFLSNMSHELRTPMNAILGFSQLLKLDETLKSNQKDSVDEILIAGSHLLNLINKVLDLSIIEEGRQKINLEDTSLSKVIDESLSTLSPIAENNNITLINKTEIDYIIYVDSFKIKQVIINLVSNAIKYNNKNGKVFISVDIINNKIRISVKDTGPGLSKEKQENLFVAFERLGYENGTIEGSGIGLVLSKKLVELMNGSIGMHSVPHEGCTFYIEFPYKP